MKQYLGDGVYCEFDGFHFKLTTDNGYGATNMIFMSDAEIDALVRFRSRTYKSEEDKANERADWDE